MNKFIALSKNTKIDNSLKDFNFIFNDMTSKKVFDEINKDTKAKSYILNEQFKNSKDKFFIGDKDVYMIYVLSKLLELGAEDIVVYDEKKIAKEVRVIEENIIQKYKSIKIENEDIFIITKNLVDKVKYGALLAKKIFDANIKLVAIEIENNKYIYEIAGAIKNLNKDIKIAVIGKTIAPKRVLMTNPIDYLLFDKKKLPFLIEVVCGFAKIEDIDGIYYYDSNYSVKFV